MVEHEFGRRIARRVRIHLEELLQGSDARDPLARYLKTYSIFILDHTTKEGSFFIKLKEKQSLSEEEEMMLKEQFNCTKFECVRKGGSNLMQTLRQLESTDWMH